VQWVQQQFLGFQKAAEVAISAVKLQPVTSGCCTVTAACTKDNFVTRSVLSLPKTSGKIATTRLPIVYGKTSNCPHETAFVVDSKGAQDLPILMEIS